MGWGTGEGTRKGEGMGNRGRNKEGREEWEEKVKKVEINPRE